MSSLLRHKGVLIGATTVVIVVAAISIAASGAKQSPAKASTVEPIAQRFGVLNQAASEVSRGSLSEKAKLWLGSIQGNQRTRLAEAASSAPSDMPPGAVPDAALEGSAVSSLASAKTDDGSTVVVAGLGQDEICAFDEDAEIGTCATQSLAEAGHAFVVAPAGCGSYHVLGVMPDGVSSLAVSTASAHRESDISVTANVYEATLSAERTVLNSANPAVEVVLPLDRYATMNPAC